MSGLKPEPTTSGSETVTEPINARSAASAPRERSPEETIDYIYSVLGEVGAYSTE